MRDSSHTATPRLALLLATLLQCVTVAVGACATNKTNCCSKGSSGCTPCNFNGKAAHVFKTADGTTIKTWSKCYYVGSMTNQRKELACKTNADCAKKYAMTGLHCGYKSAGLECKVTLAGHAVKPGSTAQGEVSCAAGTFSGNLALNCTKCAGGKYQSKTQQKHCDCASAGHYGHSDGTKQVKCAVREPRLASGARQSRQLPACPARNGCRARRWCSPATSVSTAVAKCVAPHRLARQQTKRALQSATRVQRASMRRPRCDRRPAGSESVTLLLMRQWCPTLPSLAQSNNTLFLLDAGDAPLQMHERGPPGACNQERPGSMSQGPVQRQELHAVRPVRERQVREHHRQPWLHRSVHWALCKAGRQASEGRCQGGALCSGHHGIEQRRVVLQVRPYKHTAGPGRPLDGPCARRQHTPNTIHSQTTHCGTVNSPR